MDVAALSVISTIAHVKQQAGMQVLKMVMDTSRNNSELMTQILSSAKIMEQSVNPHLGANIDIRV